MKGISIIIAASIVMFGTLASRAANVDRISAETGVPVATLQAQRASTGLGWGGIEKAHLLANASGRSFDDIFALHQGGQGWGKIAHANGLNLGKVVSGARHSSHATMHAHNGKTMHGKNAMSGRGKSATNIGRGHTNRMSAMHGGGHRSSFRSGFSGSHGGGMHSMGHMGGGHHGR